MPGRKRGRYLSYLITKASGEQEKFDVKKLKRSLSRAGASPKVIGEILDKIDGRPPFKTAKEIYQFARSFLKKHDHGVAGRYNLKNALRELGPSGYPFEKFVGEVFKQQGFAIKLNQFAKGKCISHELDVVLENDKHKAFIECKFHNRQGLKTDVKVPMYVKARFEDFSEFSHVWVVTNTKFTRNAIRYGECVGMKLMSWSYPRNNNLAQLIDKFGIHPVTALTSLTKHHKKFLIERGVVLCSQLCKNKNVLKKLNLGDKKIERIITEAKDVCGLNKKEKE